MKTAKRKANWVVVGKIGVDAGLVWIGDPCYILHKDGKEKPKEIGKSWEDFCDKLYTEGETARGPTMKSFGVLGACVATGFGDSTYTVKALVEETSWGKRVCAVKVVFIKPSERRT